MPRLSSVSSGIADDIYTLITGSVSFRSSTKALTLLLFVVARDDEKSRKIPCNVALRE